MTNGDDPLLVFGVWSVAAASLLGAHLVITRMVKRLLVADRAAWEREGRPIWFVPPPRRGELPYRPGVSEILATQRTIRRWLLRTPEWARADAVARRELILVRCLHVVALAAMVAWVAIAWPRLVGR